MSYQPIIRSYLNIQDQVKHSICILCHRGRGSENIYGPFHTHKYLSAHLNCLLFAAGLCQKGCEHNSMNGFIEEDILLEAKRGSRLNCSHCRQPGATVGCFASTCRKSFHFPCGVESKMLNEYYGEFRSFCNRHMPKQEVPSDCLVSKSTCIICQDSIENIPCFEAVWAPCCKKSWFHRSCLQKLATNAGHHFRCPACSNNTLFRLEMKRNGIFVLEQKASWDMEPAELQELVSRHKRCDNEKCLCPKGRDYNVKETRWELRICSACGSKGVHVGCGNLNILPANWECEDCAPKPPAPEKAPAQIPEKGKTLLKRRTFQRIPAPVTSSSDDTVIDEARAVRTRRRSREAKKHKRDEDDQETFAASSAPVSRNVAKRSRKQPSRYYTDVRFVIHEEPEETWVFYGEKDDDLPHGEPLSEAIKQCSLLKGYRIKVEQTPRGKTIWVWCGKPWDSYKYSTNAFCSQKAL